MSQELHIQMWDKMLSIISGIIDEKEFERWFKPIKSVSYIDSKLTILVKSDFFREYLEKNYMEVLKFALSRLSDNNVRLEYMVKQVESQPAMRVASSIVDIPANNMFKREYTQSNSTANTRPTANVYPGIKKNKLNPRLNPIYCFDNIVRGECNKMGIEAGITISKSPGNNPFNPLFIFGGPGLGKTHLAQAIGIAIKQQYPDLSVLYVTGNEFKTQYMDNAGINNKLTDFLAFYMRIDVLIVDDIQDLGGDKTQQAFFNIFNHLKANNKQLIFASDRPPVELKNFEERLLSRLKSGLSVQLERPSYEVRLEALRKKCIREGALINDDILQYIAKNCKSNFRELEGVLISLMAHATYNKHDITMDTAAKVLGSIVITKKNDLSISQVQQIVGTYFKISPELIVSKSRQRHIVQARQIVMYLCRTMMNYSLSAIGVELGGKDHATVLHACSTVSNLMDMDKNFKQHVTNIEKMLVPVHS